MKAAYFGNPWLGMFIRTNDKHTLLPIDSMDKLDSVIRERLGTTTLRLNISDSNLLGVYVAMNSNGIILPNVAREEDILKVKELGLNVHVSADRHNANGNNIAANDKGGIINPYIERDETRKIGDALGIELVPLCIAGFSTVGSACVATNNGFLAHFRASDNDMAALRDAFRVQGSKGTVNTGTGFVSYGAIANGKGYVAGEDTTPFEMGRLEEALGLIK